MLFYKEVAATILFDLKGTAFNCEVIRRGVWYVHCIIIFMTHKCIMVKVVGNENT